MQTLNKTIDEQTIKTLLSVVDAGLVQGMGYPTPGRMCVEAAVCYALGLPHGDNPVCVGSAVRRFKINLNDSGWSSDLVRAAGMRKLAVAQLGSDIIDQQKFAEYVVLQTVKRVLPIALRCAGLEKEALDCEKVETLGQAKSATYAVYVLAGKASLTSTDYRASRIISGALWASDAAVSAVDAIVERDYIEAVLEAFKVTAFTGSTIINILANETETYTAMDAVLLLSAQIGLEALQAQNSPGCKWLYLC